MNGKKLILPENDKLRIVDLYENEKIGLKKIGRSIKLSTGTIKKVLIEKNIKTRSISEGTSLGQIGVKLSEKHRLAIKLGQINLVKSGKRKQTGGICKNFIVNGIKCHGTYEKYYIEKLVNENQTLPYNSNSIITPYGVYYPDFEFDNMFIEIKCKYTYDVMLGLKESRFDKTQTDNQHKKILWVSKNVKPVKIIIIENKKTGIYNEIILK